MIEGHTSKFVTVGEAMAFGERVIAAVAKTFSTIDAQVVESLTGKVPDEDLKLARVQIQEVKTVALLKLRRRLSPEGLQRFLESKNATGDVADDDESSTEKEPTDDDENP